MAGKVIDNNATGVLIVIIPIAFALVLLFTAWPVLVALVLLGATWSFWQRYQWLQLSQKVNFVFKQLVRENQGRITVLDLAMKANVSGTAAKRYLDAKAEEFGARAFDYEDKGIVYYFITASILSNLFDDTLSEPDPEDSTSDSLEVEKRSIASLPESEEQPEARSTPPQAEAVEAAPELLEAATIPHTEIEAAPELLEAATIPHTEIEAAPELLEAATMPHPEIEAAPELLEAATMPHPEIEAAPTPPELETQDPSQPSLSEEVAVPDSLPRLQNEPIPKKHPIFQSLIQSELARRLDVHSSTVYKRRADSDFAQWSSSRDPDGIAWEYSEDTKEFYPSETSP